MNFLKTLFWVVVAVSLAIFFNRNWNDVPVNLWGNLQADVKLPVLLAFIFLLGFLPTFIIYRGKMWALRRRLALAERPAVPAAPVPAAEEEAEIEP